MNNVFGDSEDFNLDDWLTIFPEIIKKSCNCMYIAWLVEELRLRNKKLDEVKSGKAYHCAMWVYHTLLV